MNALHRRASPVMPGDRRVGAWCCSARNIERVVQSRRDGRVHVRLLGHAREENRELGLTIRIGLRQDLLEMLPSGSDTDLLVARNLLEITPARSEERRVGKECQLRGW